MGVNALDVQEVRIDQKASDVFRCKYFPLKEMRIDHLFRSMLCSPR